MTLAEDITSDLADVVCRPSRMAITNGLPSVFCWVSQMASCFTSSFIRGQKTEDRCAVVTVPRHFYKRAALRHTTLLSSVLCPLSSVYAAEATRPTYTPPPPAVSSGNVVQIIFSLLLVLAAIVLVGWLLKRMNVAQQNTGNLLKVLGSVPIGQRERIVLVEVNDTCLVVGIGPGQIRTLHTFQRTEDRGQKTEESPPDALSSENKFANLLSSVLNHRKQKSIDK